MSLIASAQVLNYGLCGVMRKKVGENKNENDSERARQFMNSFDKHALQHIHLFHNIVAMKKERVGCEN